jgi:hypothetical protein
MAQSNPQIHNLYEAYRKMYEALGVRDIDKILNVPQQPQPMDTAQEHIQALGAQPFQAFRGQDHRAHVTAHLNFMETNFAKNNPMLTAALQKNILEHISLMASEQTELEFKQQTQEMQQKVQQIQSNPQIVQQNPQAAQLIQLQAQNLQMQIESRKAILIAEMMDEFMKEEKQISGEYGNDPLAQLKARELDLLAKDNERKAKEGQERINIDKMKALLNQHNNEEKLQQNEQLAELRSATSLMKQHSSNKNAHSMHILKMNTTPKE